jgi:O-antigen/teichoic acid export membrane protein
MQEANRAFFSSGTLNLVKLICGYARVKFIALSFGTAGVGLLAQANQLQMFGITMGTLALGSGMIQRMIRARANGDRAGEAQALGTVLRMQVAVIALLLIAGLFLQHWIRDHVFDNKIDLFIMWMVLISAPIVVMGHEFLGSSLYGRDRYDLNVRANIISTILGLFIFIGAAYWYGIPGAVGALLFMAFAQLGAFLRESLRVFSWRELFCSPFSWTESRAQLRFGAVVLFTGVCSQGLFLLLRSEVVQKFGFDVNGWVHVPFAISAYYLPLFTGAIWGRLFLVASDQGLSVDPKKELDYFFRICVLGLGAIQMSILVAPKLVVALLYSPEFLPSVALLNVHFIGDAFYIVGLITTTYLLGQGKLGTYCTVWVIYLLIYFAIGMLVLRLGQTYGISLAHAAAAGFMAMAGMIKLRLQWRNFALLLGVVLCVSIQNLLGGWAMHPILRLILAILFIAAALHVSGGGKIIQGKIQKLMS